MRVGLEMRVPLANGLGIYGKGAGGLSAGRVKSTTYDAGWNPRSEFKKTCLTPSVDAGLGLSWRVNGLEARAGYEFNGWYNSGVVRGRRPTSSRMESSRGRYNYWRTTLDGVARARKARFDPWTGAFAPSTLRGATVSVTDATVSAKPSCVKSEGVKRRTDIVERRVDRLAKELDRRALTVAPVLVDLATQALEITRPHALGLAVFTVFSIEVQPEFFLLIEVRELAAELFRRSDPHLRKRAFVEPKIDLVEEERVGVVFEVPELVEEF